MHVHLPKPLHGWREFAGEVGIIVLGVLIALGSEQVVVHFNDRSEAAELRKSMKDELAVDRARWEAVHHDVPCSLIMLDSIIAWASQPGSDRLARVVRPTMWTLHDSAWQIARSSPKMAVLPVKERDEFSDLYFSLEFQQRAMEKALDDWNRVTSLAQTANKQTSREALPQASAEPQNAMTTFDNNFAYVERRFDLLGIKSDPTELGAHRYRYANGCPPIQPVSTDR